MSTNPILMMGMSPSFISVVTWMSTFAGFRRMNDFNPNGFFALGGIVPNLLRTPKAMSHGEVLDKVRQVRATFADRELHLFGVGGTATLHVAALLGLDSVDSSGWRVRAARGIVQLTGIGDRAIAETRQLENT